MPELQKLIMNKLYEKDIWEGFTPIPDADLQGWNGDHPSLNRLATLGDKLIVVDVGVWKGMSTINMAIAMKEKSIDGCIVAVDTFLGSPEHWKTTLFNRYHGLPNLFDIFMSNVYNAKLQEYIVPMPQTSSSAAKILLNASIQPSIVHIDAAHEYEEVIRDIESYYNLVVPGGYLIGDDYHATWPGVVRAAGEFSARHGLPLEINTPKWIVQKPDF